VVAFGSLLAVALDPPGDGQAAGAIVGILAGYAVYALLVSILLRRNGVLLRRQCVAIHAVDLAALAGVGYITGTGEPLLLTLAFVVVAAAVRWRRAGVLWTSIAVVIGLAALGTASAFEPMVSPLDRGRALARTACLVVVAGVIGYVSAAAQQRRSQDAKLASWTAVTAGQPRDAICRALALAADILTVPRVILLWHVPDEPDRLATWSRGDFRMTRAVPALCSDVVVDALAEYDFLCEDASRSDVEVVYFEQGAAHRYSGDAIGRAFAERFSVENVLSVGMGESGRLFFLDRPGMSVDDLALARIVAHQVMAVTEHVLLVERSGEIAAATERARLARDLHDGLVQSLAALALQLEATARHMDDAARATIERIQDRLREEQARLRWFVTTLQPMPGDATERPAFSDKLHAMATRLEHDWRVTVKWCLEGCDDLDVASGPLARDVYFIVHEAVSNAARHGAASTVRLRFALAASCLSITVADDGHGFPFHGRYGDDELRILKRGPASLHARIGLLGGRLAIESGPSGTRLDIELPLAVGR
jgi:signal transduction histidine kinase